MSRTLALAVSPGEVWAALEEDGELTGLHVARDASRDVVGAVYLGRVVALRPELPAALVDIGLDRPAFLDARDADREKGIAGLTEGATLLVEVIKATRADKAAGVRVLPADDARRAAFAQAARAVQPPARLDAPEPAILAAAKPLLTPPPDRILIDERGALAELRRADPRLAERLAFHGEATPLFDALGIADAIEAVLQPRVALPGGGTIVVEPTHAATLIDVDGGARKPLDANLAAAVAIARQIRLRNLAGPIVIDFVGMTKREDRDKVAAALTAALAEDREKRDFLGWTKLGHFELVRRRGAPAVTELFSEPSPEGGWRKTGLTLALAALRAVDREAQARPGKSFALAVHPDIAAALDDGAGLAARQWLEARLGRRLAVTAEPNRARDAVDIRAE
ncbi:MAG TPA: ribonuclease E/G [Stellaceae bacterium]